MRIVGCTCDDCVAARPLNAAKRSIYRACFAVLLMIVVAQFAALAWSR